MNGWKWNWTWGLGIAAVLLLLYVGQKSGVFRGLGKLVGGQTDHPRCRWTAALLPAATNCWPTLKSIPDHVAFDPEHRLVLSVVPGKRTEEKVQQLVGDFKERTGGRIMNLRTSDEYPAYKRAARARRVLQSLVKELPDSWAAKEAKAA